MESIEAVSTSFIKQIPVGQLKRKKCFPSSILSMRRKGGKINERVEELKMEKNKERKEIRKNRKNIEK